MFRAGRTDRKECNRLQFVRMQMLNTKENHANVTFDVHAFLRHECRNLATKDASSPRYTNHATPPVGSTTSFLTSASPLTPFTPFSLPSDAAADFSRCATTCELASGPLDGVPFDFRGEKSILERELVLLRFGRNGIGVEGLELRNWGGVSIFIM